VYAPGFLIQRLAELQVQGTKRQMAGDEMSEEASRWQMVVAEIMTSVNIIV
jgi:hypothetical protein